MEDYNKPSRYRHGEDRRGFATAQTAWYLLALRALFIWNPETGLHEYLVVPPPYLPIVRFGGP